MTNTEQNLNLTVDDILVRIKEFFANKLEEDGFEYTNLEDYDEEERYPLSKEEKEILMTADLEKLGEVVEYLI